MKLILISILVMGFINTDWAFTVGLKKKRNSNSNSNNTQLDDAKGREGKGKNEYFNFDAT